MNDQKFISISVPQSLEASVRELLEAHAPKPEPCQTCLDRKKEREGFPYKFKNLVLEQLLEHKYDFLTPLELAKGLHEAGQFLLDHSLNTDRIKLADESLKDV